MILVIILYLLVISMLLVSWKYTDKVLSFRQNIIINTIFVTILIGIVAFKDGSCLPDYDNYVEAYIGGRSEGIESSFILIRNQLRNLNLNYIYLFITYAILSVGIRYYAIWKYAPYVLFSITIWLSTFYLLHDLIQIRAAVSSSILLLLLPNIYNRKWITSIFLCFIAFFFHRSAIIFFPLLFLSCKKSNWALWIILLIGSIIVNISRINILSLLGLDQILNGLSLIEGDIYMIKQRDFRVNMFAPYTFLQILTCIMCILNYKKIKLRFPESILFIKTSIISLLIYSLSLGVVSTRLSELLSTCLIFLYPCAIDWVSHKQIQIGKLIVSIIALFILTNFIFLQHFIKLD